MRLRTLVMAVVLSACGTDSAKQVERDRPPMTEIAHPDVFVCYGEIFDTTRCFPTKAEDVATWEPKNPKLAERAWCFDAPPRGGYSQFCFMSLDDCTRRFRLDPFSDGSCVEQDAKTARGHADELTRAD